MTARRGFSDDWLDTEPSAPTGPALLSMPYAPPVTPEVQHRAALTVVRHVPKAHAREVLAMLGLVAS